MNDKNLSILYAEHTGKVTDKWSLYLSQYDRIFSEYRTKPIKMLEIGIQNGGSLEIWSRYFSNGEKFVGCDINPDCGRLEYEDQRIAVVVGDACSDNTQYEIQQHCSAFDIVIDDGSHFSSDIIKSFARYFPKIVDGGVFVAEDLHCSYWQEYEGGLFDPFSSISFFKWLADIINHEHWGVEKKRTGILRGFFEKYGIKLEEDLLAQVHSVEFMNSTCVVRKSPLKDNLLGRRIVAGNLDDIVPGLRDFPLVEPKQMHNFWSLRELAPPEELLFHLQELNEKTTQIDELNQTVAARDGQIAQLSQTVAARDGQIAQLSQTVAEWENLVNEFLGSNSWRLTAPLRTVVFKLKRLRIFYCLALRSAQRSGGFFRTGIKTLKVLKHEGLKGVRQRLRTIQHPTICDEDGKDVDRNDYAEWIRRYDTLTDKLRKKMAKRIEGFAHQPLISVVMPTYNPNPVWLAEAIEAVRSQLYPNWELCIADDASTNAAIIRPILERYAKEDSRIKVVFREKNGHISASSNSALEFATGEYVALLDHDDLLAEHALFWVADAINQHPDAQLIYSDEDKICGNGERSNPYFKCDWNPDLFYSHNMICHLGVYRLSLIRQLKGFREGLEGAQDYDLALRCIERIEQEQIIHIPRVLYHWRVHSESTASASDAKPYAMLAGEKALNEHMVRQGIRGHVELLDFGMYRTRYDLPDSLPLVSLIIPTRNGHHLVRQCIESVLAKTSYSNYEIIIVDNGSDEAAAIQYFKSLEDQPCVRVLRDDRPFNYSALNNAAVQAARGELICLLNNDIEVISPDWLTEMVSLALQPGVGAVGARLWYPNDTLQHGGVIIGLGGVAGHSHKHLPRGLPGYLWRANLVQGMSAVTAACLVIRKVIYENVEGLNETDLQVAFNDVDFCLRVREAGYRNVWTPYADLYHHESATRGHENTPEKQARFAKEVHYMQRRWNGQLLMDPAYSPNLTLSHEDFSLAWPPRVP